MKSRKLAIAGMISALSLATVPIAAAAPGAGGGSSSSPDRAQHVAKTHDKKTSPDLKNKRDKRTRDKKNHR